MLSIPGFRCTTEGVTCDANSTMCLTEDVANRLAAALTDAQARVVAAREVDRVARAEAEFRALRYAVSRGPAACTVQPGFRGTVLQVWPASCAEKEEARAYVLRDAAGSSHRPYIILIPHPGSRIADVDVPMKIFSVHTSALISDKGRMRRFATWGAAVAAAHGLGLWRKR